jgi:hydrogenase maturation factor
MALCVVDEKEAAETFAYLDQMGELAELEERTLPAPLP